jgi:hypothetical protein
MNITIPPDMQIAGIIVALVAAAVFGVWIYLKSTRRPKP